MSAIADKKKIAAEEVKAVLKIAERLYRRDKERFRKLIVWVNTKSKANVPAEQMLKALQALEQKEHYAPVRDWWSYLEGTLDGIDRREEAVRLRRGDPTTVSSILAECFRRANLGEAEDA